MKGPLTFAKIKSLKERVSMATVGPCTCGLHQAGRSSGSNGS